MLRHVGKAPDLVVHSSGKLEGFGGRRPRYKRDIDPPELFAVGDLTEQLRFMRFVESIPSPTPWDRTRR